MSKLGVFLARQELTTVYNHFDVNKDGNICYEEFITTLRVSALKLREKDLKKYCSKT